MSSSTWQCQLPRCATRCTGVPALDHHTGAAKALTEAHRICTVSVESYSAYRNVFWRGERRLRQPVASSARSQEGALGRGTS